MEQVKNLITVAEIYQEIRRFVDICEFFHLQFDGLPEFDRKVYAQLFKKYRNVVFPMLWNINDLQHLFENNQQQNEAINIYNNLRSLMKSICQDAMQS
jgi:hypothetical protein